MKLEKEIKKFWENKHGIKIKNRFPGKKYAFMCVKCEKKFKFAGVADNHKCGRG